MYLLLSIASDMARDSLVTPISTSTSGIMLNLPIPPIPTGFKAIVLSINNDWKGASDGSSSALAPSSISNAEGLESLLFKIPLCTLSCFPS